MTGESGAAIMQREFERILRERRLQTVFQPIVHLETGATVGYEALVRGPERSRLVSAESLLAAAYQSDHVVEFDWAARASACRAAMAAGLDEDQLLFLNVEPLALDSDAPRDLWPDIKKAFEMFRVVLEITERSLDRDPGALLDGLDRQRPTVAGFALDDVGSDLATLSMLPIVAPAVIKLAPRTTMTAPNPEIIQVLAAVYGEAERTGATILAEGIETAAQADLARSLGAHLGQGRYFGAPGSLAEHPMRATRSVGLQPRPPPTIAAPFDALHGQLTGRANASLLILLGQQLESGAVGLAVPALLITLVPDPHLFGPTERRRLTRLVNRGVMAAVLGPGVPAEPGSGIRGVGLRHEPELVGEWAVVALSPYAAGALLARAVPGHQSEFEFGITHDPHRVIAAARCLFRRLGAPTPRFKP